MDLPRRAAWLLLPLAAGLVVAGCGLTRAGYESAPYRVVRKGEGFELRRYPPIRVAETADQGDSFLRLFRYIDRNNGDSRKISMTTPVWMDPVPERPGTMAFVLPSGLTNPPAPGDGAVRLSERPGGTWAVRRFRGSRQGNDGEALARLRQELSNAGISPTGPARFAYYDPPWIPGFLRRNEAMLPVATETGEGDAGSR